jgi:hypothetical protein
VSTPGNGTPCPRDIDVKQSDAILPVVGRPSRGRPRQGETFHARDVAPPLHRCIAALPLAALLLPALAAAAFAAMSAHANNRGLQGTPDPASGCVEYRRSPGLTEDTWTGVSSS